MACFPLSTIPKYDDVTAEEFSIFDDPIWKRGIWILTQAQLQHLTNEDLARIGYQPKTPLPLVARMYVAYNEIIKKLDSCWSVIFQYQKSQAMRRFLDAATCRLLELKDALTELDISEYHYIDNQLIELKLIPNDLEIIDLQSYPVEQSREIQELAERLFKGERIYVTPDLLEKVEEEDEAEKKRRKRPVVEVKIDPVWEQQKIVIKVIQKHERARIGRLEFLDEKTVYLMRLDPLQKKKINQETANVAATNIQKLWRGYRVRRDMRSRNYKSRLLLKMDMPSWRSTKLQGNLKGFNKIKKQRREEKVKEYITTNLNEKERVLRVVGPGLMEDIGDEIRWWFRNWYDVALTFDKYPSEEHGGTNGVLLFVIVIVIRGETMTPEEYRIDQENKRSENEKLKNNPALARKVKEEKIRKRKEEADRKRKEKKKIKMEKRAKRLRAKKGIIDPFTFKETPALRQLSTADEMYKKEWTDQDEELADNDKLIMDRITVEKCYEVQLEIRKLVDEVMRLELALLEAAHAKDRNKKPPKDKKKAKKKRRKGKKVKKDITGHRSIEDIFQELYDNGIIKQYPKTNLNTFIGDYGYKNFELRSVDYDPLPAVGEVRQLAVNLCILPLGGNKLPKPKSVLICGPRQSGKKHLVYSICTATSAVMFDLSPQNMAGKYPGKKGRKMFIHLVNKMSRLLQPVVIFIEGGEKTFYKKVPKLERSWEPKKLKGQLFKKIVKLISPEDRVMLIGTTNQPWAARVGPMLKAYEKFIMIPRTDYGTCYQLWMDILMKYHAVLRDIDVSSIAKLSVGYPVSYLREVASQVLCPKRLVRLRFEPLRQHELLEGLMLMGQPEPVTDKEQQKFTTWYNSKTKMGKLRTKIVNAARQKREQEEAQAKKKRN